MISIHLSLKFFVFIFFKTLFNLLLPDKNLSYNLSIIMVKSYILSFDCFDTWIFNEYFLINCNFLMNSNSKKFYFIDLKMSLFINIHEFNCPLFTILFYIFYFTYYALKIFNLMWIILKLLHLLLIIFDLLLYEFQFIQIFWAFIT